jgi:hypothetical protein
LLLSWLELLKSLPTGAPYDELNRHIGRQVRALIAHEEPLTAEERQRIKWAVWSASFAVVVSFAVALKRGSHLWHQSFPSSA